MSSINIGLLAAETSPRLSGFEEIDQRIRIIVSTPLGSVPLFPDFGNDIFRYIDLPTTLAQRLLIDATLRAIKRWETGIEITEARVDVDAENARLTFALSWKLPNSGQLRQTAIVVNG